MKEEPINLFRQSGNRVFLGVLHTYSRLHDSMLLHPLLGPSERVVNYGVG